MSASLKSLTALRKLIIDGQFCDEDRISSWSENATIYRYDNPMTMGDRAITHLFDVEYDAIVAIEEYTLDSDSLFDAVTQWLVDIDHDSEQLGDLNIDIDVVDNHKTDIEISVRFLDSVYAEEVDGKKVYLDSVDIETVESIDAVSIEGGICCA